MSRPNATVMRIPTTKKTNGRAGSRSHRKPAESEATIRAIVPEAPKIPWAVALRPAGVPCATSVKSAGTTNASAMDSIGTTIDGNTGSLAIAYSIPQTAIERPPTVAIVSGPRRSTSLPANGEAMTTPSPKIANVPPTHWSEAPSRSM